MSFAERYGYRQARVDVQLEGLDEHTRTALWNAFHAYFVAPMPLQLFDGETLTEWLVALWLRFFKQRIDRLPREKYTAIAEFERVMFGGIWFDVYSLLELAADHWHDDVVASEFRDLVNKILTTHMCGYRFVGGEILRITEDEQVEAIMTAQSDAARVPPARDHLARAVSLLNDRHDPDYANSIKESIAAVEAVARFVTGKEKATLGDALKQIPDLHPALRQGWLKLYGYTSDAGGIRHAATDEITTDADHALYFLVTSSAFVSLLLAKAAAEGAPSTGRA